MRITFYASNVETVEYLRTVSMILRNNKEVDNGVKAFNELKKLVESVDKRLNRLEESGRNRVCR